MSPTTRSLRRWAGLGALVVAMGLVTGLASAGPAQTVARQEGERCNWIKLGNSAQKLSFAAAAMDTTDHALYFFGGQDEAGKTKNIVEMVDLAGQLGAAMPHARVNTAGSLFESYGLGGAYRPKGDLSAVYWSAGSREDGRTQSAIQELTVPGHEADQLSSQGQLSARVFLATAYDPVHDVVVIVGGASTCDFSDPAHVHCNADQGDTLFLKFDPITNVASLASGPRQYGPGVILGHSMVYDPIAKRMIVFGGSLDGQRAESNLYALNLAEPGLNKAVWAKLNVPGGPQARYFHTAAFDATHNRMVVLGGVNRNAFTVDENALSDTWALNFGGASPVWENLNATVGQRVGAVMVFDDRHDALVLHGGRSQYKTGNQSASGETHALICGVPTPGPTATITPTREVRTATPRPTPPGGPMPQVCPFIQNKVPQAVILYSLANKERVQGWGLLCYPNNPPSPFNVPRTVLTLLNGGVPYQDLSNPLVYKCGCP